MNKKTNSIYRVFINKYSVSSSILLFFILAFLYLNNYLLQRFLPGTIFFNTDISSLTLEEAENKVDKKIDEFLSNKKTFSVENKKYDIVLSELGISSKTNFALEKILKNNQNISFFERISLISEASANSKNFYPSFAIDKNILKKEIKEQIPESFVLPRDAEFFLDEDLNLVILGSKEGQSLDTNNLSTKIIENIENNEEIEIPLKKLLPVNTTENLKDKKSELEEFIKNTLVFKFGNDTWGIDLRENFHSIKIYPVKSMELPEIFSDKRANFNFKIDESFIKEVAQENFLDKTNYSPKNVILKKDENGKIYSEGELLNGSELDLNKLISDINKGINSNKFEYVLSPEVIQAKIISEGHSYEINDLLARGESNFAGSSAARIHNVKLGISRLNGSVIMPGEEFSFLDAIGEVTLASGYLQELVIKEGRTVKETGGGLCQVSTTMFRASVNSGLPITNRKPHSFAVRYYLPYGLDAAVYIPNLDLRFINDTKSVILIKGYTEGLNAYFDFYGKSDGRKVKLVGPSIYNKRSAQTVIKKTTDLAPGESRVLENPVNGFDTSWVRKTIFPDGEEREYQIYSRYKAWPKLVEIGVANTNTDGANSKESAGIDTKDDNSESAEI